jgi:V/A-type H+-transporting ATPase subunit F
MFPRRIELENNRRIAVVGAREQVLPYLAIGATVFITDDREAAKKAVIEFAEKMHPVILVSDDLIREMEDILNRFSSSPIPSITAIPGKFGGPSFSDERMKSIVKKAIGLDISGLNEQ